MGQQAVTVAACLVAVAAAIRSAWSPCSLSMLSMLTPFGEHSRGNRYPVAATAFVVGAVGGGACLGVLPALAAAGVRAAGIGSTATAATATALAVLAIAGDVGAVPTPRIPRQVNESWFGRYRPWVYGVGYGWQLGTGLTTYLMTTAVYLMLLLAALTASPPVAVAVCAGFGALRGVTVLLGVRLSDPEAIRRLHRRLEVTEPASRALAIGAQGAVVCIGLAALAPLWSVAAAAAVLVLVTRLASRVMASRQASAA